MHKACCATPAGGRGGAPGGGAGRSPPRARPWPRSKPRVGRLQMCLGSPIRIRIITPRPAGWDAGAWAARARRAAGCCRVVAIFGVQGRR